MDYDVRPTKERQRLSRLVTTILALCLPIVAATFFSGSFFKLGTLQPGQVFDATSAQAASHDGMHHSDPNAVPANAITIALTDSGFAPSSLTIAPGATIAWMNHSSKQQAIRVTSPVMFGSALLNEGDVFVYVFGEKGIYPFRSADGAFSGSIIVDSPQETETGTTTPVPGCSALFNAAVAINGGFTPQSLTVAPGTRVTWTNNGSDRARVRDINHVLFDSDDLQPGQSWSYVFCNSGSYPYENARSGATGLITVSGTPGPTGTTTAQPSGTVTAQPSGTAQITSTPNPNAVNVYAMSHDVFSPQEVTISTGTTVRWTNMDDEDHTSTSDTGVWNSGVLHAGQWFEFTFLNPGDYRYTCLIHGQEMNGTIHVTGTAITPTPGSATNTPEPTPGAGTVDVSIQNYAFAPRNITILVGGTVRWTNLDPAAHTTTSDTGLWNSGDLGLNGQFSYTFNTPGTYTYHCDRHPGMSGTITVVTSLPTGTPTSQPTGTAQATGTSQATGTAQTTQTAQSTHTAQTTATAQSTGTARPTGTTVPQIVDLTIQNYAFNPITITVQAGTTVRWTNLDADNHTITASDGSFSSPVFGQNGSWHYTFSTPGTYEYYCQVHGVFMTGWVVVQPADPNACPVAFSDVPAGSTFYDYVRCLACQNVLGGYPDGTFHPNAMITRGQLSKIVSNAASFDDTPTGQTFSDVAPGSTFYLYIERMASRGIIGGYSDGTFRPNNSATRGQIAKIVSNAAGYNETPTGQTFADVAPSSTFYLYVERIAAHNIISGYPCGGPNEPCGAGSKPYFRWANNATRGQLAKIVSNGFFPDCTTP